MLTQLKLLCRARPAELSQAVERPVPWLALCCITIIAGCGAYGWTIGLWRAPVQGLFTAIKFPSLVLLTTLGNVLFNGLIGQLLGIPLGFRQSSLLILFSLTIFSLVLGALSPVTLFLFYNTPPLTSATQILAHNITLLSHVFLIAFAGIVATLRLFQLLLTVCPSRPVARRVFLSWLAGNFLLGSQLSWIMRPFIGSPGLPVEFFRPNALQGNFYESVWRSLLHVLNP